jgi:hypothetical protein
VARIQVGKTGRVRAEPAQLDLVYASGGATIPGSGRVPRLFGVWFTLADGRRLRIELTPEEARELCHRLGRLTGNGDDRA